MSIGSMQCESEYRETCNVLVTLGCLDIRISTRIKKHSVFNKLVVSLKFTVHDQFGVLAPQFLPEGRNQLQWSLLELNSGWGGENQHCS